MYIYILFNIQRIEKGEVIDVGEYGDFFHASFDGNDVISSLPKHVAILVRSFVFCSATVQVVQYIIVSTIDTV